MGDTPQSIINAQLLDDCDLGIAVFWSRLGTATSAYPSGSAEEVDKLIRRGARVLVYFNDRPIPQTALRDNQYIKLQELRQKYQQEGLLATYTEVAQLRESVNLHLTNVVTQLLAQDRNAATYVPASGTLTAPTPDVRLTVNAGFAQRPGEAVKESDFLLAIKVSNYSPVVVHINSVYIEAKNHALFAPEFDYRTQEYQRPRELQPGRSLTLTIDPAIIKEHMSELVCAAAQDDIGRVYRSSESELTSALDRLFNYYLK